VSPVRARVVPQALNESWGLFYCKNILVSKRELYLYIPKI